MERSPAHFYEAGGRASRRQWLGWTQCSGVSAGLRSGVQANFFQTLPTWGLGGASMGNSD